MLLNQPGAKMHCFNNIYHAVAQLGIINVLSKPIPPQRMINKNLGPDRLAGPNALDPNFCRQPTL